ncbi:MAG: cupredoxin domain-containing protein [Anaerolineales bacterium]
MKRIIFPSFFIIILALLLSSCSMHLGLSKLLGGNNSSNSTTKAGKHIKATHTPPSPSGSSTPESTPSSSISLTPGSISSSQTPAITVAHGNSVTITSAGTQPNVLKLNKGKAVTWTNNDSVPESVTSDTAGLFDSGLISPGAKYTYTFAQAGTFKYHSTTNPNLFGAVVVLP